MKLSTLFLTIIGLLLFSCTTENNTPEEFPSSLNGTELTYQYSEGNSYNLKFNNDSVSYRFLTGPKPEAWWGPFKYDAVKRENGESFLSWYEHGYGDYITPLISADKKTLYSVVIPVFNSEAIVCQLCVEALQLPASRQSCHLEKRRQHLFFYEFPA